MDHNKVTIRNVDILFPFKPYNLQVNYMNKVVQALQMSENAALESPTGTGKTLSLLCSSLAWLEQERAKQVATNFGGSTSHAKSGKNKQDASQGSAFSAGAPRRTIFYTSRTHSQLTQALSELKRTAYNHVSTSVLASREHYCIHDTISKETDRRLQDTACNEKVRSRTCYYYTNVEKKKDDPDFRNGVMDVEDLVAAGKKHAVCPYYLSKELQQSADITFAPYNYLLDAARTKKMGVEMAGAAVIIDEAHNVEQVCEDVSSSEIKLSDIAMCLVEVHQIIEDYAKYEEAAQLDKSMNVDSVYFSKDDLVVLKDSFLKIEREITDLQVPEDGMRLPADKLEQILAAGNITKEKWTIFYKFCTDMATFLSGTAGRNMFKRHGAGVTSFANFVESVFRNSDVDASKFYRAHVRNEENIPGKKRGDWLSGTNVYIFPIDKVVSYWCFSPSLAMKQLLKNGLHSLIMTSGTLAPLRGFIAQLQIPIPIQLENPHIIDESQVFVGIVKRGVGGTVLNSSYQARKSPEYKQALGLLILNVVRNVKGGVLVFFPSYTVMTACKSFWEEKGFWQSLSAQKRIYIEEKKKSEFTDSMNGFYDDVKKRGGAIFMAVCRGKVSEGLDFSNDNCRAVIITGIPYCAAFDPRVQLKKLYLDEMCRSGTKCLTGNDWYQQDASRAVNQAIGRVIRHANDYGAIILAETRFDNQTFINNLSSWVRPRVKRCEYFKDALGGINTFFNSTKNNPKLQIVVQRAATVSSSQARVRNAHNVLMPSKSPVSAMEVTGKRSFSEFAKRPPPRSPSTRADARVLAMYIGEPSPPKVMGGLYSAPAGRKKMKLVVGEQQQQENKLPSIDFLAVSSVTPAEAAELEKKRVEALLDGETIPEEINLKGPWFLRQVKKNASESEYGRVSDAFRDFKEKRSLNYERLLDTVFDILLKNHKLTYLYDNVHWFVPREVRAKYTAESNARREALEKQAGADGDQDLFE